MWIGSSLNIKFLSGNSQYWTQGFQKLFHRSVNLKNRCPLRTTNIQSQYNLEEKTNMCLYNCHVVDFEFTNIQNLTT